MVQQVPSLDYGESSSSISSLQRQPESSESGPVLTANNGVQVHTISNPNDKQVKQEEKKHAPRIHPQDVPSSGTGTYTVENEEVIITSIVATDVTLGLRRLPAGFYAVVHHSGLEWRTENKCSSVGEDVVEWAGPIPLPSSLSVNICLEVHASFEFQPVLGDGERLRKLTITVEQLLDHSKQDVPFAFPPENGDVVPCSSIIVIVERWRRERCSPSASTLLNPHCSTAKSYGDLEQATNRGHHALSRYRKHANKQDLERSIQEFEHALTICSLDHPCRAAAQSNLAMAKFVLCLVEDTDSCEVPLHLYHDALTTRPTGHVDRPSTLIQLAAVHLRQFKKQGKEVEIARAEALLREAIELSTAESHERQAANFMLQLLTGRKMGLSQAQSQSPLGHDSTPCLTEEDSWISARRLLDRFECFGDLDGLQQAIALLEVFIRSTPVSDHRYRVGLANLALALLHRFDHLGELDDLEKAISRQREAVDAIPRTHPDKPTYLNNLADSFFTRFTRLGHLSDLENAISKQRDALDLTLHGHPNEPARLSSLGNSLKARFEHLGEPSDLEEAILRHRNAVNLTPDDHPDKAAHLNNLGSSVKARFLRLRELSDLEDAILVQKDAVELTPDNHPNKPTHLGNLGNSYFTRFSHLGKLSDLEGAMLRFKDAVNLTPDGNPNKPAHLNNLGNSFLTRFERLGELSDLEKAISSYRNAIDLTPCGHPSSPRRLSNLASSLRARFHHLGELRDLEEAIARQTDAVDLTPYGHPDKPAHLNNLANSLSIRFDRLGELVDLEKSISRFRDAVDITPESHAQKPIYLNNLGNSIRTRFERLGDPNDLEEAVSSHKTAVGLIPLDYSGKSSYLTLRGSERSQCCDLNAAISMLRNAAELIPRGRPQPVHLNNLGNSLIARFEHLGELSDLEEALSIHRDAVCLTPDGHADKPAYLNNLGNVLFTRFRRLGDLGDLEKAISIYKDTVCLTPDDHPDKRVYLNNFGNSCFARFERLGDVSDLEQAISRQTDAIHLAPEGHPDKSAHLNNLGSTLRTRFERLGDPGDLEKAISRQREAIDLTPHGHPDRSAYLNNLGSSLRVRFEHLKEPSDIDEAILRHNDAIKAIPGGHPDKPAHLNNLGNSLVARFGRFGELNDLEQALSLYLGAASASIGPISVRFRASQRWISCARSTGHRSLLDAYSVTIGLLPQLAWVGHSLTRRYHELTQGAGVVQEAAAAALDSGFPETAVEWLEQGRSIVWGGLLHLRDSFDELLSAYPDHARRLRVLSAAVEHSNASLENSLSSPDVHCTTGLLHQGAEKHHTLAIQRDKLLQEIRTLPGFERFLLHKEFSQLRASAHLGPVVTLNAAETRCDALIILASADHVIHVPLPNFTLEQAIALQEMMKGLLGHFRTMRCGERALKIMKEGNVSWALLLTTLWNSVVKLVLEALNLSPTTGELPRIFWCPTGPFVFLPFHAAGLYDTQYSEPGHKVSDFAISSYIPTLSILAPSPEFDDLSGGDVRLLAVGQPSSDGLPRLPGVDEELQAIRTIIGNSPSTRITLLESSVGTVEEVLSLMKEADWVHFACHGVQDATNPTNSGLCLANRRRLNLSDIIALSRPRGGFAFLSSCHTATGDEGLADEAIHIAAGMLFAGYRGAIGTMWSVSDRLAPDVAKAVYEHLFRNGEQPDHHEAARALHEAVKRLRESGASFNEWLPFIHIGF